MNVVARLYRLLGKDVSYLRKWWLESIVTAWSVAALIITMVSVSIRNDHDILQISMASVSGAMIGACISFSATDKLRNKYKGIAAASLVSFCTLLALVLDTGVIPFMVIMVLFVASAACAGFTILEFFAILYHLTNVLERGRVLAGVLVAVVTLGPVMYLAVNVPQVEVLLVGYQGFLVLFIVKRRLHREAFLAPVIPVKQLLDAQVIRYTIILSGFGFIEGLFFRPGFFNAPLVGGPFSFVVLPSILSATLITAGVIFDLHGRRRSLSLILLLLGAHALLTRLEPEPERNVFSSGLFAAAIVMSLVALLIIIADISVSTTRVLPLTLIAVAASLVGGFGVKIVMASIDEDLVYFAGLLGLILISIVLINTGDSLSRMEKEWDASIVSMYVMHVSGLLLYHHDFNAASKVAPAQASMPGPAPDLISSGLVGVTQLLQEIMQGKQIARAIDHFSKKILLESGNTIILALVTLQDLRVLREKARTFIEDFEIEFHDELDSNGVNVDRFAATSELVNKHFMVKYLGER